MASTTPPTPTGQAGQTGPLTLTPLNTNVYTVHTAQGDHVGNLKRIGAIWKLKAIGYDADGAVLPGGGPLTDHHNTVLNAPDAIALNAVLADRLLGT